MVTLTNHKKSVRHLVGHPKQFTFCSGAADNIKKWQCADGKFLHNMSGHNSIINCLAVNSDDVFVSGGDDGSLRFWDYQTGYQFCSEQSKVQPGSLDSEAGILAMSFDRTGSRLITCESDKTIKIWAEDMTATPETHPIDMEVRTSAVGAAVWSGSLAVRLGPPKFVDTSAIRLRADHWAFIGAWLSSVGGLPATRLQKLVTADGGSIGSLFRMAAGGRSRISCNGCCGHGVLNVVVPHPRATHVLKTAGVARQTDSASETSTETTRARFPPQVTNHVEPTVHQPRVPDLHCESQCDPRWL